MFSQIIKVLDYAKCLCTSTTNLKNQITMFKFHSTKDIVIPKPPCSNGYYDTKVELSKPKELPTNFE
jgi:hypothetical protein